MRFVLAGDELINIDEIRYVNYGRIEDLIVVVRHADGVSRIEGIQALELLMQLKPAAFESRRLRWKRHAWALHNLVGHPLMQLLAFFRLYKLAMFVHDQTVPRPLGRRS
jgi:hypothetical protein